ncbi:MAG: hypothetical protein H0T89_31020 [Deltaproteobacteria bacterium]|nr:hypothetical protein [Deltaproteobacteria bacterium]
MTTASASQNTKLSSHTVWLFALGSTVAGIGASYAAAGFGQKAAAAVYFAAVAIGGFGSTYLTRARVRGAVVAFLSVAVVAAVVYFMLVDQMFRTATTAMTDVASGGAAHQQGVEAGATFGKMFGIIVAAVVFLETIIAGIGGAIAGSKVREKGGITALGAMGRAAS